MSAEKYLEQAQKVYDRIRSTQLENIRKAGRCAADSIAQSPRPIPDENGPALGF